MHQLAAFTLVLIAGTAQAQISDPVFDSNSSSAQSVYNQNSNGAQQIYNQNSSSAAKTHYMNSGADEQYFNDNYQGDSLQHQGSTPIDQSYPQPQRQDCYGCAQEQR